MGGLVYLGEMGKKVKKSMARLDYGLSGAARSTELPGEVGSSLLQTSHLGVSLVPLGTSDRLCPF